MTREDLSPLLANKSAPFGDDEAAQRATMFADWTPLGLVGCKFRHIKQFRNAMADSRWGRGGIDDRTVMDGVLRTIRITLTSSGGIKFVLLANEWGDDLMEIINGKLVEAGDDLDDKKWAKVIKDLSQNAR